MRHIGIGSGDDEDDADEEEKDDDQDLATFMTAAAAAPVARGGEGQNKRSGPHSKPSMDRPQDLGQMRKIDDVWTPVLGALVTETRSR